jgi:hypothetical protein
VKVTATVQLAPLASGVEVLQFVPEGLTTNPALGDMLVKVTAEPVLFVTVTVCAGLVIEVGTTPKGTTAGVTLRLAAAASILATKVLPAHGSVADAPPQAA